jgi:hypothetical protein
MRFLSHNTSDDIHMSKLLIIIPTPHKDIMDKLPLVTNITEKHYTRQHFIHYDKHTQIDNIRLFT